MSSLLVAGWLAVRRRDFEGAATLFEESVAVGRQAGDDLGLSYVLYFHAGLTFLRGDLAATRRHAEESLTLARKVGFNHGIVHAREMLAQVLVAEGDPAGAWPHLADSLTMMHEIGKPMCCAHNLEGFARLALAEARPQRAARLLGGADAALTTSKTSLMPTENARYEVTLAAARAALTPEAFAAAWDAGRAMTLERAVAYALADGECGEDR